MVPGLNVELKTKERLFGALLAKSNDEGLMLNEFRGRCCPQPITGGYKLRSVLASSARCSAFGTFCFASTLRKTSCSRESLLAMGDQRDLDLFLS